jgi:hypothetical protein
MEMFLSCIVLSGIVGPYLLDGLIVTAQKNNTPSTQLGRDAKARRGTTQISALYRKNR